MDMLLSASSLGCAENPFAQSCQSELRHVVADLQGTIDLLESAYVIQYALIKCIGVVSRALPGPQAMQ